MLVRWKNAVCIYKLVRSKQRVKLRLTRELAFASYNRLARIIYNRYTLVWLDWWFRVDKSDEEWRRELVEWNISHDILADILLFGSSEFAFNRDFVRNHASWLKRMTDFGIRFRMKIFMNICNQPHFLT